MKTESEETTRIYDRLYSISLDIFLWAFPAFAFFAILDQTTDYSLKDSLAAYLAAGVYLFAFAYLLTYGVFELSRPLKIIILPVWLLVLILSIIVFLSELFSMVYD